MRAGVRLILLVLSCLLLLATTPDTEQPLNGYSAASSRAERDWEKRFRALPEPQNLRDYMQRLARARITWARRTTKTTPNGCSRNSRSGVWTRRSRASMSFFPHRKRVPRTDGAHQVHGQAPGAGTRHRPHSNQQANNSRPTTHIRSTATSPLRWSTSTMAFPRLRKLERLGISVKGAIVIARYGNSWRGIKPKVAAEHGAVGCLIYSDPARRRLLPGRCLSRGLAPARRRAARQRHGHAGVPAIPYSRSRRHGGCQASCPERHPDHHQNSRAPHLLCRRAAAARRAERRCGAGKFRGALPLTYHVGPGPAKVHLKVHSNWDIKPLYDVIVKIPGSDPS